MTAVRVLSFDLDDTLWPIAPVIVAAEAAMWQWLRSEHPEAMRAHSIESVREIRARIGTEFPERAHDMTFLRHRAIMELFASDTRAQQYADAAFEVFFAARNQVTLYPEVQQVLGKLRGRFRLFALSNGNADLKRCGLADFFEGHVSAISAGAAKPDARIFAHLARAAGVSAAQVLHIGDDPYTDVHGAREAGMQALWLNRDAKLWPEALGALPRTVKTLSEILSHQ
jgi:putative hydrolase of the HAD superfamily